MADLPDDLAWGEVAGFLGPDFPRERYHRHGTLDSTNTWAASLARAGAGEGTLVVAERQTRGRGRLGRVWVSPSGVNLAFSVVLRPGIAPRQASQLTLLAGVALREVVVGLGCDAVRLKWPNDLLIHGRKVAGILAEMSLVGERVNFVVLGVGINVNTVDFPVELMGRAGSLAQVLGRPLSRAAVLGGFVGALMEWYGRWLVEGFAPVRLAWLDNAAMMGQRVVVTQGGETLAGVAVDLDGEGCLLVRGDGGGVVRVVAGDVVEC